MRNVIYFSIKYVLKMEFGKRIFSKSGSNNFIFRIFIKFY